jgi:hypothetical protein
MSIVLEDCLSSLQALLNPVRPLDVIAIDGIVDTYLARSASAARDSRSGLAHIFQEETRQSSRRDQIIHRIISCGRP